MAAGAHPVSALADTGCANILPNTTGKEVRRAITARDLVTLRDIGGAQVSVMDISPFSISPDRKRLALIIRRADPDSNSYCQALIVMALRPGAKPEVIDSGGEVIRATIDDLRGMRFPTGIAEAIVPRWSPDGKWIAYRKCIDGITQLKIVAGDGSTTIPGPSESNDVEDLNWASSGQTLIYTTRPSLAAFHEESEAEGRAGYLYDKRFTPMASTKPFPPSGAALVYTSFDLATRQPRLAGDVEQQKFTTSSTAPKTAHAAATSQNGNLAWTAPDDPERDVSPVHLHVRLTHGRTVTCDNADCEGEVTGLWWEHNGRSLLYMRRAGWADSQLALYRWRPGNAAPQRLVITDKLLFGCQLVDKRLLCGREDATRPRSLVFINPDNGGETLLFDPNPEYASLEQPQVERLTWTNDLGLKSWGNLVLPPGHQPGQRHPLIVTQYRARGFQRGGVGEEYPIPAFAARGFAVLNIERPPDYAASVVKGNWKDWQEARRYNIQNWADRRSTLSSLLAGIEAAKHRNVIIDDKIAITGLSDAATTAVFALINQNIFAAASIGTCCEDPHLSLLLTGPVWYQQHREAGYPALGTDDKKFWGPVSLSHHAANMHTPLLMQLSDDEYLWSLEAWTALKEAGQPVELRIFPNERHYKWQPAHRLAIFERNLDWFDYWLFGRTNDDPAKRAQWHAWKELSTNPRKLGGNP